MEDPLTVKRKDALAERPNRRCFKALLVYLHAAVDHIDVGKQLRFLKNVEALKMLSDGQITDFYREETPHAAVS